MGADPLNVIGDYYMGRDTLIDIAVFLIVYLGIWAIGIATGFVKIIGINA